MKTVAKIIAVAATAIVVVVSNPLATFANGGKNEKVAVSQEQVSVKYQGTTNNTIAFKVEFDNTTGEKFSLIIKNDNGDVVYHGQFNEAHFSKNVYFENTDADIHPTFIIRTANNSEIVRQFQVTKTMTENTTVTQL